MVTHQEAGCDTMQTGQANVGVAANWICLINARLIVGLPTPACHSIEQIWRCRIGA
jgi:hypothetical protein